MSSKAAHPAVATAVSAPVRHYYLDWLRVIAVLVLLVYHVNLVFDPDETWWLIKSVTQSPLLVPIDDFLTLWRLPLLFLVSGVGTYYALGFRSATAYLRDRFLRLVVPFVFGVLILVPPQVYIERLTGIAPGGDALPSSLLAFYPVYWLAQLQARDLRDEHVWFLRYLFIYSLLALPLFLWLRTRSDRWVNRLIDGFGHGWRILLLTLPIVLIVIFPSFIVPLMPGASPSMATALSWRVLQEEYFVFFLYGYLIASSKVLGQALLRNRHLSLLLAVTSFGLILLLHPLKESLSANLLSSVQIWFWVVALLGYAQVYLTRSNAFLGYATRAVLPFYVLHQTIIVLVAYLVLAWPVPLVVQYLAIVAGSFSITALLCELVRRFALTRFLFGMSAPRARPAPVPAAPLGRESGPQAG